MKKFFSLIVAICAVCSMSASTFALYVQGTDAPQADDVQAQAEGILSNKTITTPVCTITDNHKNADAECQVLSGAFRWTATDLMTIKVASGVTITKIEFVAAANSKGAFTATNGSISGDGKSSNCVWTGSVTDQLVLTAAKQVRFSAMIITYFGQGVIIDPDTTVIDPDTTEFGTTEYINGLEIADAYYYTYYDGGTYWDVDLYVDWSYETGEYTYPEVYVTFPATSKTSLAGTHECVYAGYWKSANDSIEAITATAQFNYVSDEGDSTYNYDVVITLNIEDVTFIARATVNLLAYDEDSEDEDIIVMKEGGSDPVVPTGTLSCAEAQALASQLSDNEKGPEVTVVGYVTSAINAYDATKGKQSFWMADTPNGGKQFEAYWGYVSRAVVEGEMVSVTGVLQSFKGTAEISDGQVTFLGGSGVENVKTEAVGNKFMRNGQILIMKDGKTYNMLGTEIE